MDIRQFRAELADAFQSTGFQRKKIKGSPATIWLLPGREVERMFWEHAMRRPWGFLLSGSMAVDVPAFRTWLTDRFPRDQLGVLWGSLSSRNIANEADMFFGTEAEDPPYRNWVQQIRVALAALPDTIDGLLKAQHEPERLRMVWDDWASPKVWRYFTAWAEGKEPDYPPPYMTPTGQIIESPANDMS